MKSKMKYIAAAVIALAIVACEPYAKTLETTSLPDGTKVTHYEQGDSAGRVFHIFVAEKDGVKTTSTNYRQGKHNRTDVSIEK